MSEQTGALPVWCVRADAGADGSVGAGDRTNADGGVENVGALPAPAARWARAHAPLKPGTVLAMPGDDGALAGAIFVPDPADPFAAGKLNALPARAWRIEGGEALTGDDLARAHAAVALGAYRFERYRKSGEARPTFEPGPDGERTAREAAGVHLARDLINTPASDMGPAEIERAARDLARRYGAAVATVEGEALEGGFPMIHAVGRASARRPRLIDMAWGNESAPKVTLVGKGVAFDTGGLDIKSAANMVLMKKDMGGAAAVLGLAHILMDAAPAIRLRVLIPAVENAIDGNAFRPSDVLRSRSGLTVEVGNTDAEGRLVLADALTLAGEDTPDLLIDMATLTGAARVALGPDLPPMFTRSNEWSDRVERHGVEANDPVWRMPLWLPYRRMMKSDVADTNNIGGGPMAGAIIAALFLDRFVTGTTSAGGTSAGATSHVHLDIYGWCPEARPHCPKGGEAQAIRALSRAVIEWAGEKHERGARA